LQNKKTDENDKEKKIEKKEKEINLQSFSYFLLLLIMKMRTVFKNTPMSLTHALFFTYENNSQKQTSLLSAYLFVSTVSFPISVMKSIMTYAVYVCNLILCSVRFFYDAHKHVEDTDHDSSDDRFTN
jgi:hypothetical protein